MNIYNINKYKLRDKIVVKNINNIKNKINNVNKINKMSKIIIKYIVSINFLNSHSECNIIKFKLTILFKFIYFY